MQTIICFVSDFGLDDAWVGVCHAVIHRACPQARVVDLGHNVPPFDIRKGAATAVAGVHQLPDAIHLVVVDPGVGGGRDDLCIITHDGVRLVGPDNGVLLPAANRAGGVRNAFAIDPGKLDRRRPLATFHARDVLAPAAAALACGVEPESLGAMVPPESLSGAPFTAAVNDGGAVVAEVLETDRFGSLRLTATELDIEKLTSANSRLEVALGHLTLEVPFVRTFADVSVGETAAMIDSSGWLTLAINAGSAAERYGVEPGTTVRISARD